MCSGQVVQGKVLLCTWLTVRRFYLYLKICVYTRDRCINKVRNGRMVVIMCVSVLTPPADGTGVQKGKMIMQTKVQVESIAPPILCRDVCASCGNSCKIHLKF